MSIKQNKSKFYKYSELKALIKQVRSQQKPNTDIHFLAQLTGNYGQGKTPVSFHEKDADPHSVDLHAFEDSISSFGRTSPRVFNSGSTAVKDGDQVVSLSDGFDDRDSIFNKKINTIIDLLLPTPGVEEQEIKNLINSMGGVLKYANAIAGQDQVKLLRRWLKKQRMKVNDARVTPSDYESGFGWLSSVVYGRVQKLIATRNQEAKEHNRSDAFMRSFEGLIARKPYGHDADKGVQPDWDAIHDYADTTSPTKNLYIGRMYLDRNNIYHLNSARKTGSVNILGSWVADIRYSKYIGPVPKDKLEEVLSGLETKFTPVSLLGRGLKIYEQIEIKRFQERFYQRPSELIWKQIGTGKGKRWSVWYQVENGWLWAPLSHPSSKLWDYRSVQETKATRFPGRKVWCLGDLRILARKATGVQVCDVTTKEVIDLFRVTCTKRIFVQHHIRSRLIRTIKDEPNYVEMGCKPPPDLNEILVFSQPITVTRYSHDMLIKEVYMTLSEWADISKSMAAKGWTKKIIQK